MISTFWFESIQDFGKLVGKDTLERIVLKAQRLRGLRVMNVSSTFYGGGVAEMLSSLSLFGPFIGLRTDWRLLQGSPDFFSVTKKIHNALQGDEINLSDQKKQIYEQINYENSLRMELDHDLVVVHDPQPLPLITHYRKTAPWIWRCHVDLSNPDAEVWAYLRQFAEGYDTVILSLPEYAQDITPPQLFFMPAIAPFTTKNKELSEEEMQDRLRHYGIPDDLPIVAQISRFDRWKDPMGVIEAVKIARREVDCTLVLLGNIATDDPEGQEVFESLLGCREERIIILSAQDTALVNTLQRKAAVIMQKSIREGFGLTVTEAMWKRTPVIGGNCGGIRKQIEDGVNGFLVSSVEEAAQRLVQLLKDPELRREMGRKARETVREKFLMPRLVEQYLDLFNAFETTYRLDRSRLPPP